MRRLTFPLFLVNKNGSGTLPPPLLQTRTRLCCVVNTVAADDVHTLRAIASTAKVLN